MASGLLLLLDDIASILDDVAVLTKTTVAKTAGVVGDDLALNAQQVTGVSANRELPIVWAVAKGSAINKGILVPAALFLSWAAPWAITPLLIVGGLYLCFEGCEKLAHKFLHSQKEDESHHAEHLHLLASQAIDVVHVEKEKIRGAIRTDFILSAEIIVIALGIVETAPLMTQLVVMVAVAVLMTVGVYGLVAAIVKIDDIGAYLVKRSKMVRFGRFLLGLSPYLMRFLTIAGTAAMFFVGGGILVHKNHTMLHALEPIYEYASKLPAIGFIAEHICKWVLEGGVGILAGSIVLVVVTLIKRIVDRKK
jgi:uncharacterized protein